VDLDIKSNKNLQPLLNALNSRVFQLHSGRMGRQHWVRLELSRQPKTPDEAIRRFCRWVETLPPAAKKVWNDASHREFDIGIQAGGTPAAEWLLDQLTLKRVAMVGGQIKVTVYCAEP
jgi:hypothetical protein